MIEALKARLMQLAALGQTITYGDLARELSLPSPAIQTLTRVLENLMEEDAAAGRPFLAALLEGRLGDGLPSLGFFEKAALLDAPITADPAAFVAGQRAALAVLHGAPDT
ncbi:MAG: hypothetical protein U5N55_09480 [Cypionkella sp.]|nr:hypothetical protein [Cypionkella sp.]